EHVKVGADIRSIVSSGGSVWLARASTNEVLRVDAGSREIAGKIAVDGTPARLAVAASGVWVGVTDETGEARLLRYDRDGTLRETIGVREGIGGLVAAGGAVWVIKAATNKLARVRDGRLVDWAALPGEVRGLGYGDGALWATMPTEDAVAKVQARTGRS